MLTVKTKINVTHMITYANPLAYPLHYIQMMIIIAANLVKFVIITQNCATMNAYKTVTAKGKIITVINVILYADQYALQLKIARVST